MVEELRFLAMEFSNKAEDKSQTKHESSGNTSLGPPPQPLSPSLFFSEHLKAYISTPFRYVIFTTNFWTPWGFLDWNTACYVVPEFYLPKRRPVFSHVPSRCRPEAGNRQWESGEWRGTSHSKHWSFFKFTWHFPHKFSSVRTSWRKERRLFPHTLQVPHL